MPAPEILAPAGNAEMLRAAVFAGADAVYLGLDGYNARRSAGNFTPQALREAVGLLADMKNPLEREVWAAKIAADYGTTKEGVLAQAQAKLRRRARAEGLRAVNAPAVNRAQAALVPEKSRNPAAAAAEERLIGALFRHPEAAKDVLLKISGEDFTCGLYRRIFDKIMEAVSTGNELSLSLFGENFTLEEQSAAAKNILRLIFVINLSGVFQRNFSSLQKALESWSTVVRFTKISLARGCHIAAFPRIGNIIPSGSAKFVKIS